LRKIYIASDHAGYLLKKKILEKFSNNQKIIDLGPNSTNSVDYPDFAKKLSRKVASDRGSFGVLVCGSGTGMAIAANKTKNIRAAMCFSAKNTQLSRLHNNANIITLGSRLINKNKAFKFINIFIKTKFEGGRHKRRVKKIN
jgi:ribose 5-phosphate isomerase B|tara:strand:+ start:908 stop:1333 length:426 start_codon:yes stop_codon:yes gene_type:complete